MKKYTFIEISCVFLVIIYIFISVGNSGRTLKTSDEIFSEVVSVFNDDALMKRDIDFIKKTFEIDLSEFSSVSYYSTDDVMNVGELFVGVLSESSTQDFSVIFEEYATDKFNLYDGYAPEQAAYLDDFVMVLRNGAILFCVGKNAQCVLNAFYDAV